MSAAEIVLVVGVGGLGVYLLVRAANQKKVVEQVTLPQAIGGTLYDTAFGPMSDLPAAAYNEVQEHIGSPISQAVTPWFDTTPVGRLLNWVINLGDPATGKIKYTPEEEPASLWTIGTTDRRPGGAGTARNLTKEALST